MRLWLEFSFPSFFCDQIIPRNNLNQQSILHHSIKKSKSNLVYWLAEILMVRRAGDKWLCSSFAFQITWLGRTNYRKPLVRVNLPHLHSCSTFSPAWQVRPSRYLFICFGWSFKGNPPAINSLWQMCSIYTHRQKDLLLPGSVWEIARLSSYYSIRHRDNN